MKTLTVSQAARDFSAVMSGVESDQEEVVITRNRKPVARLIPEPPEQDALQVFGDLFDTIDDATADSLTAAVKAGRSLKSGTLKEQRTPQSVGFLIDSSLWIAVERGTLSVADIHAITKQRPIFVSPVNIAEISLGL